MQQDNYTDRLAEDRRKRAAVLLRYNALTQSTVLPTKVPQQRIGVHLVWAPQPRGTFVSLSACSSVTLSDRARQRAG